MTEKLTHKTNLWKVVPNIRIPTDNIYSNIKQSLRLCLQGRIALTNKMGDDGDFSAFVREGEVRGSPKLKMDDDDDFSAFVPLVMNHSTHGLRAK